MRHKQGLRWAGVTLGLLASTMVRAQKTPTADDLIVHEWGTFLTMNGSDGVTLDGMYHEEHALPEFVHARSQEQLRMHSAFVKGETPVIYFYTPRRQRVQVTVRFPRGVWTQWYPQAETIGPQVSAQASALQPRNGHITWNAELLPVREKAKEGSHTETQRHGEEGQEGQGDRKEGKEEAEGPKLPATESDALWNYARQVDAAYVRTTNEQARSGKPRDEYERFLFYRGLGRATMPLTLSDRDGVSLSLSAEAQVPLRHLFVLRVENGRGVYKYLPSLASGASLTDLLPSMANALPLSEFGRKIADDLAARLVESGLYPKEARAMVNTWKSSYFQSDGLRVLYILPQSWTDGFIPMEMSPRPKQLVRVMVGRTELLTPEREKKVTQAVNDLASSDATVRQAAFATLQAQGRYAEPILRRIARAASDPILRQRCQRLLLTDWINELRASLHAVTNGEPGRVVDDVVHQRAQLAMLLREAGLNDAAKTEGEAVLAAWRKREMPGMNSFEARFPLRDLARAQEGIGSASGAAQAYGKLIAFGSGVQKNCGSCHDGITSPKEMAWFRDWYAGRKYAEYVARSGRTAAEIADNRAILRAEPNNAAAQMKLAYLYEAQGVKTEAALLWNALTEGRQERQARRATPARKVLTSAAARFCPLPGLEAFGIEFPLLPEALPETSVGAVRRSPPMLRRITPHRKNR